MKVINVGLSILISMGLAVSPIHANEIDSTDETNEVEAVNQEETTVNDESNVESQTDEKKIRNISVRSEDSNTEYTLDENETKTIKLIVTKCYEDGTEEETTDYQYKINNTGSNIFVSNSKGKIQDNVLYSGSDNVLSVKKTSRGEAFFNVDISMDGYYVSTSFTFKGTNLVNITLNAGEGHFEDGTSTFTYKGDSGISYMYHVIAPEGYGFKGWYDENGVEINNHELTSDTTFYAKYAKLVKVTFDAGKGHFDNNETIATRNYLEYEYAQFNAPVAPDGLVFCGWYDANGNNINDIQLTKDITVYAKYGHSVKVTFDAKEGSFEDGTNKAEKEIAEGTYASYSNPTPPEGFRFLGWFDKDGVPIYQNRVEKDTIFYAKYAKVYNVIFDAKEGHFEDGSTTFTTETTENGYYPYCPTPVGPDGMMFVGWYDVNGKSMYECTIDQKMTFYAKYAKAYDVTFDAQEGHFEDGEKKVVIKSYEGHSFYPGTIIAPEGKVFDGWYDENGNKINDSEYKGNTTYYAHYKDAITITLEPNGGTGNSIQYKLGVGDYQYFSYSNSYFTHPDGKVLVGFKDKKTGKTYALDSGDQFYKDVTLYAQWADPVTVTFDCNGGSTDKGSLIKETCGKNSGLPYDSTLHQTPVKKGKIFTGWHIGSVDGPKLEIYNATFDKDTVLYASYTDAVTLTINYEGLNQESTTVDVAKGDSVSIQNYVNIPDDKYTVGYKIDGVTTGVETYQGVVFDKNTTITVVVANKIKLTYDSNGAGFDAVTQTVSKTNLYGGIFNNVFGKTPEGKYLAGWAVGSPDGKVYTSTAYGVPFREDTTLYAVWKDGCTINLDLGDGDGADGYAQSGKTVKKGTSIRLDNIAITQPLEGKELVGWRIDDNEKIIDKYAYYVVNKDITLHAVWADMITVTVQDPETDEVLYTSQIAKGTSFNEGYKVENHLPEGKSLFGWTLDKNKKDVIDLYKTKFDKDVVLYPIYVDSVKVTLDWGNDGGSGHLFGSNSNTFESGKGLALDGFNFNVQSTPKGKKLAGFRIGDTNQIIDVSDSYAQANGNYIINQDTTLHAVWKDSVTVTFNANGEKFENNQEIMKIDYIKGYSNYNGSGTPWEQKNLKGTKVITGWRIGSPSGPLLKNTRYSEFDSDKTYYAVWSDLFTVTFKNDGIKVAEFNNTNTWTLRNIYYRMTGDQSLFSDFDDELLVGWYNVETGEKLTEDTVFTKDCVFEARTEKKPVKVILDYNGGFGELKEVTTMGGYFTNEMLSDPYLEIPKNKVFVGWSLEKDGDVLKNYYYNPFYVDKDTTLYAKYEDEITLTIHNKDDVYTQKVPVNEWMMFVAGDKCEIEGKIYYSGQPIKFTKNEDVYIKNSSNSSSVTISYRDLTKINGYGIGYSEKFTTWSNFPFNVHENSGTEIKLELNEEFIPEGMVFDKWVTEGNITVKDPTSKKTTFTMPKAENGKRYEIYATFKKEAPIQFEKDSVELTKGERSQLKVNGDYETLTWSSSDPTTVQVDQSGNIHAVKSGKATIRVTNQKGKRIECVVTVTNKLKSLALSVNKLELKGKTEKKLSVTLTPGDADDEKLTWSSSDEKVVKVSNDGTVTTVSCGEATITVKSESGLTDSCKVTVSHDWKLDSKVDATVDKEGKKVFKCTLCNETKEEVIPKLNGKWVTDSNGKWYQYSDGTYEKSGFKEMNGKTYYFQSNGYVKTGWLLLNNSWYMFNADGSMITGWHGDYYFDENGKMKTNAFVEGYYLGADGKYVKNQWIKDGGKDYFMDANGKAKKNAWQGVYYLGKDGAMLTNTFTPDGYYVGSDGAYYTNRWIKVDGKYYYMDANGKTKKNAWQGAYYLGKDGVMLTNAFTPDGYYVGSDGVYVRNQKVTVDGKVYYLNADGKVAKNQWSGDYYLDGNGNVVKNKWIGNYWCGEDGKYVKSSWVDNNKYYVGSNGVYVTNQWVGDYYLNGAGLVTKNAWVGSYWCGEDGKYVKSSWVDNNKYYVGANGIYVTNQWVGDYYLNGAGLVTKNAWVGDYWCGSDGKYVKNTWAGNYWCGADGRYVRSSWVDNGKYYVGSNGVYVTNQWVGDYYLNGAGLVTKNAWVGNYWCGEDGKYVKSSWVDNGKYYVGSNGIYVTNQWIGDYYLNGSGVKVTNTWEGNYWCGSDGKYVKSSWVDNNRYYVNENGVYVAGAWQQDSKGWKYHAGSEYAKDITLNINGTSYTFDSNGYMK